METKIVHVQIGIVPTVYQTEYPALAVDIGFKELQDALHDGFELDSRFKGCGIIGLQMGAIYHLIKFASPEEKLAFNALEKPVAIVESIVESMVSVELQPIKTADQKSLVDEYLAKGYVIDTSEKYAAKSTKYVNMVKLKKSELPVAVIATPLEATA